MKKKWGKVIATFFIAIITVCISMSVYAHSGRTDSSGGHKDKKNKSGLGYYHYHCGGNSAHLHKNGVCPYSKSSSKSSKSTSKSKKSSSSIKKKNTSSTTKKSSTNTTTKTSSTQNNNTTSTVPTTEKISKNENNANTTNNNTDESNAGGTLVALGILGGGSYLGYKKYKKSKE